MSDWSCNESNEVLWVFVGNDEFAEVMIEEAEVIDEETDDICPNDRSGSASMPTITIKSALLYPKYVDVFR